MPCCTKPPEFPQPCSREHSCNHPGMYWQALNIDELTCTCGVEVLLPPIPCGTKPPECSQPCSREHTCNHPGRY